MNYLKHSSKSGSKQGNVVIFKNNTKTHEILKAELVYELLNHGFEVYTECDFNKPYSGRCDVFGILNGEGYIFEVVCSETESRLLSKKDKYPPLEIVKIGSSSDILNCYLF